MNMEYGGMMISRGNVKKPGDLAFMPSIYHASYMKSPGIKPTLLQ
jgi:hypothetical protein